MEWRWRDIAILGRVKRAERLDGDAKSGRAAALALLAAGCFIAGAACAQEPVMPDAIVGTGPHVLRPVIADPVTQEPWSEKRYRLLVYRDGEAVLDIEGDTDAGGRTATVRTERPADEADFSARPIIGKGTSKAQSRISYPNGEPSAHRGYLLAFEDGAAFLGITDARGDTAEVHRPREMQVELQFLHLEPESADWHEEAAILNRSLAAGDAVQALAVYQELLRLRERRGADGGRTVATGWLLDRMVQLALDADADTLERVADDYVVRKAHHAAREAGRMEDERDRLAAILALLDIVGDNGGNGGQVPAGFVTAWVELAAELAPQLPEEGIGPLRVEVLGLCERLLADGHTEAAIRLFNSAELGRGQSRDSRDRARIHAFGALAARHRGETRLSRRLLSQANYLIATDSPADVDGEKYDPLSLYHALMPELPQGMMWLDEDQIESARHVCVRPAEDGFAFFLLGDEEGPDIDSEAWLGTRQAIDALLAHGTIEPGEYRVEARGCGSGRASMDVVLTEDDIAGLEDAGLFLGIAVYFGDLQSTSEAEQRSEAELERLRAQVIAYLQQAVLPEGKYGIVKSIPPGDFKMRLF
ncbi:hypothetical protein [Luteimonas salinilitoris]|uniref:Uncharacterized protein n=1 Tax=Luteimonas salinilitoris TaxID=3237697 RepID=A0ABV4HMM3_9GAMM